MAMTFSSCFYLHLLFPVFFIYTDSQFPNWPPYKYLKLDLTKRLRYSKGALFFYSVTFKNPLEVNQVGFLLKKKY